MKSITATLIMLTIATAMFSQTLSKDDYLQKSKNQKKVAWILLGGGATLGLIGVAIPNGNVTGTSINALSGGFQNDYENDNIKGAFFGIGSLAIFTSIPFFIASRKNKRRAARVSFKNEMMHQIEKGSFVYKAVPSLNIKISL